MINSPEYRIILINTSHPGNIGATARAMKTMGLKHLYLVKPKIFPTTKAYEMASGALDILNNAKVVTSLDDAIAECTLIAGTSARTRRIPWPVCSPREFAENNIINNCGHEKIAILFGRENSGLNNQELQKCQQHIQIAANPNYSSLNLASAVQIISYEILAAENLLKNSTLHKSIQTKTKETSSYPTATDINNLFQHIATVAEKIDFLNPKAPKQVMTRIKRLIYRASPDNTEVNILRGILSSIEKKLN